MSDEIPPLTERIREHLDSLPKGVQRTLHHWHPDVLLQEALDALDTAHDDGRRAGYVEAVEHAAQLVEVIEDIYKIEPLTAAIRALKDKEGQP